MEIQFEKQPDSSARLIISLAKEDYQNDYQSKIKDYSKKAHIKGFRPGKVPPALVERLYGQALMSDAINAVLNKTIDSYIKEHDIQILGDLIGDPLESDGEGADNSQLKFSFQMALRPEFTYPDLNSIDLSFPEIEVDEAKVQEYIKDLRKRFGKMVPGQEIKEGDLIKGMLSSEDGNFSTESSFPFSRIKEGCQSQFLGKKVGDKITFPIEEAFDAEEIKYVTNTYKDKENAQSFSGMFSFAITEVTTQELADMDSEFFQKVTGNEASTEEEFMEKIREMFRNTYYAESEVYFEMILDKYLLENTPMVLSEEIIGKLIRNRSSKLTEEELAKFVPSYLRSMRASLIRQKIADDFKINLTEDDLMQAARKKIKIDFEQMGYGSLGDDFIDRYAQMFLADKERNNRDQMAEKALAAKICQLVLEKGKIVRKSVSIEEFNKLVEELN